MSDLFYIFANKNSKTMTQEEILREKSEHYLLCYVNECSRHETCLRWLVGQQSKKEAIVTESVNPMNPEVREGKCPMYRENTTASYAIGMMHFFDQMTGQTERSIKNALIHLFSRKRFYEYRNGTRPIPPEVQKTISKVCLANGWTNEPQYDSWAEDYNW